MSEWSYVAYGLRTGAELNVAPWSSMDMNGDAVS